MPGSAQPGRTTAADPEQVRDAVARLSLGSGDATEVQRRETHISWLFLTGDRAYKLKKPLTLPFLDYGTTARRKYMCQEEIRLNRRLAPDIYLGVRALIPAPDGLGLADEDDPEAIDYLVEMRRYDEHRTLSALIARGELTEGQIQDLARTLAGFHAGCPPARHRGRHGAAAVEREVARNVEELLALCPPVDERRRVSSLARSMRSFIAAHAATLDERAAHGFVREGHGDLRAEHVVLEGSGPRIVDCVEFDAGLRTLDVADDLAFLVMDTAALGAEPVGRRLINGYRAAGGDCGESSLLWFYATHRALVRAKVLLVRAGQTPAASGGGHSNSIAELTTLSERFAWRARGPLTIVICGAPATGKSHLAAALAKASGLPVLGSDVVRKGLIGLLPSQRGGPELYTEEFNLRTYAELGRRAASEPRAGGVALVDATFRHRADRAAFRRSFADAAPLVFVQCLAPAPILAERAAARDRDPARVSDATREVVLREREAWEPLDEVDADRHLLLRTDRAAEPMIGELTALLDERWSQAAGHGTRGNLC